MKKNVEELDRFAQMAWRENQKTIRGMVASMLFSLIIIISLITWWLI